MRKNIKIGLSLLLFTAAFVSCDTTEEVILGRNAKPEVSLEAASVEVMQGGATAIGIKSSEMAQNDIIFTLIQIGGNAVAGVDYDFEEYSDPDYGEIGGRVFVPGYELTGSVNIIGLNADIVPVSKTATFELRSIESQLGVPAGTTDITVTIVPSNKLEMEFDWTMDIGGYSTADNIDHDIFISVADGFDINDPWSSDIWDAAATGDVPEVISMDMTDWGDGTFVIWHDLWANGFFGEGLTDTEVPITGTFTRFGSFQQVVVQDSSQSIMSDSTDGAYVSGSGYTGTWHNGIIAYVTIADGKFTITDFNNTDLVTGKPNITKPRAKRPSKYNK